MPIWHIETLTELCAADELLYPTVYVSVDTTDTGSQEAGTAWWSELTERGGEGMVVKPLDYVSRGRRDPAQPALKTRSREYLRIIYGPEYTEPENLERLRERGLGRKRALALREFALGIEALEPFRPRRAPAPRPRMRLRRARPRERTRRSPPLGRAPRSRLESGVSVACR